MGYDYQTFRGFLGEAKYKGKDEKTNAKTHTSCHIYKSEKHSFLNFESCTSVFHDITLKSIYVRTGFDQTFFSSIWLDKYYFYESIAHLQHKYNIF